MSGSPRVLVAHDSEPIRAVIGALLAPAGFSVVAVDDGEACLRALTGAPIAALVLDVAISGVMAFQVIEAARARVPRMPIVLVASIYNRTSYKRRPTSLYGANDYVEQHHIADALVGKIIALVGAPLPGLALAPVSTPRDETAEARVVQDAGEGALSPPPGPDDEGVTRARRLARLIVSDVALYNAEAIEAARARGGVGDELEARLRVDLEEGRLLFDLRVPLAVRRQRDFIAEALRELVLGADLGGGP